MTSNVGKASEAGFIKEISISSNEGSKAVSLQGGFFELKYYESIMSNTVKATLIYTDSGDTVDGKTARSGLPIVTEEMVTLKFEDNNKNILIWDNGIGSIENGSRVCEYQIDEDKLTATLVWSKEFKDLLDQPHSRLK